MTEDQKYYLLMEKLVHAITRLPDVDLQETFSALEEMCRLFRVCKGVTCFYDDEEKENQKDGEIFVCYDSGEDCFPVIEKRLVTAANTVVTVTAYQTADSEPFSDQERERVELILQIILTFMSQDRLKKIIQRMTCFDKDGFRNLQFFYGELSRLWRSGMLNKMAVIRIDLKHFTLINNQLGRPGGDAVMMEYYRRIEEDLGQDGTICRLGGDNFVIICRQERLSHVLDHLRGEVIKIDLPDSPVPGEVTVSAAAGIYIVPRGIQYKSPGDIMNPITAAYQAAKSGRSGDIVYYTEQIELEKEKIIRIKHDFQIALSSGELLAYYQPKVNIETGEIIGAEALCRWYHNGKIIMPVEFITVLEQGIDICKLDFYMLDLACRDLRRWLDHELPAVPVSVNFSRRHMTDSGLFDHIIEIVDRNDIPHSYIDIELTENTTEVEFKAIKRLVEQLRQAGISTSVDDFGSGYSSLNLIKEIPWNVLKLDRTLLPTRINRGKGSKLFRHVIAMAHEIDMVCVAEGIETPEQLEVLRKSGCRVAQGFYYDRPLPVKEFEQKLMKHYYSE